MANIIYDYLHESIFFKEDNLESEFSKYTDRELKEELKKYQNYILTHRIDIVRESKTDNTITSVLPSLLDGKIPTIDTLIQSSLYIHRYLIDDPIFKLSLEVEESPNSAVMNNYLGMEKDNSINRKELKEKSIYMKELSYAVYSDFIKFVPASLIHEHGDELPIKYSKNHFEEYTSQNLRDYFFKNSKVLGASKSDMGFRISNDIVKEPCRGIAIQLNNHTRDIPYLYLLFETEIVDIDEKTGKFTMKQYLPDTKPTVEAFNNWVYQTMNQVALNITTDISKDLILCNDLNSIYFTESEFVSDLMQIQNQNNKFSSNDINTMNYMLKYGIPVINDISLNDILKIRNEFGESFESFRKDLNLKMSELRYLKDQEIIDSKISEIQYELKEGYLEDVKSDIKKLSKNVIRNSTVIAGSLGWNMLTSNFNILATFMALHQGYVTYQEYKETIKYNPSYFLWKVNKNKLFK